jgi:hypothetical protein
MVIITAAYIALQTLKNFNFHHFIYSHYYIILFYFKIQKKTCNRNYTFLILYRDRDTFLYRKQNPEDAGRITGRNILVKVL